MLNKKNVAKLLVFAMLLSMLPVSVGATTTQSTTPTSVIGPEPVTWASVYTDANDTNSYTNLAYSNSSDTAAGSSNDSAYIYSSDAVTTANSSGKVTVKFWVSAGYSIAYDVSYDTSCDTSHNLTASSVTAAGPGSGWSSNSSGAAYSVTVDVDPAGGTHSYVMSVKATKENQTASYKLTFKATTATQSETTTYTYAIGFDTDTSQETDEEPYASAYSLTLDTDSKALSARLLYKTDTNSTYTAVSDTTTTWNWSTTDSTKIKVTPQNNASATISRTSNYKYTVQETATVTVTAVCGGQSVTRTITVTIPANETVKTDVYAVVKDVKINSETKTPQKQSDGSYKVSFDSTIEYGSEGLSVTITTNENTAYITSNDVKVDGTSNSYSVTLTAAELKTATNGEYTFAVKTVPNGTAIGCTYNVVVKVKERTGSEDETQYDIWNESADLITIKDGKETKSVLATKAKAGDAIYVTAKDSTVTLTAVKVVDYETGADVSTTPVEEGSVECYFVMPAKAVKVSATGSVNSGEDEDDYTVTLDTDGVKYGAVELKDADGKTVENNSKVAPGTTLTLTVKADPADYELKDDVTVTVNGKPVTANEDGSYTITANSETVAIVVTATFGPKEIVEPTPETAYDIEVDCTPEGSATVSIDEDKTYGYPGEDIKFTVTVKDEEKYELQSVKLVYKLGTDVTVTLEPSAKDGKYSFTMPESIDDKIAHIKVTCKDISEEPPIITKKYKVTDKTKDGYVFEADTNVKVNELDKQFVKGDKLTLNVYSNAYDVNVDANIYWIAKDAYTVNDSSLAGVTKIARANGVFELTMPASDIVIWAEFEKVDDGDTSYTVSITTSGLEGTNGSVTVNGGASAQFKPGDEVTLNVNRPLGYEMTLTVKDASGTEIKTTPDKKGTTYTFIMPASSVTVEAKFELKPISKTGTISWYEWDNAATGKLVVSDTVEGKYYLFEIQTTSTDGGSSSAFVCVRADGSTVEIPCSPSVKVTVTEADNESYESTTTGDKLCVAWANEEDGATIDYMRKSTEPVGNVEPVEENPVDLPAGRAISWYEWDNAATGKMIVTGTIEGQYYLFEIQTTSTDGSKGSAFVCVQADDSGVVEIPCAPNVNVTVTEAEEESYESTTMGNKLCISEAVTEDGWTYPVK